MQKSITGLMVFLILILNGQVYAQHQELSEKPETWKEKKENGETDTTSLLHAFKSGRVNGHLRYYLMTTDNTNQLADYYANAIGGGLKFETAPFHHFQFGISGFYIFNIGSSDLQKTDAQTRQLNRYEIGLFDINDPSNKTNIDRLEELYIRYNYKKSFFRFGKQLINTPFVNLQDGRMRPTEVSGFWSEVNNINNTKFEGGVLNRISPRSTTDYFSIKETFGIYSVGVNRDGTKSGYKNNLETAGILLLGITNQSLKNTKIQVWNQFVENIFNTSMVQLDFQLNTKNKRVWQFGLQSIFQTAIKDGGNSDLSKSYFGKDEKSLTYGLKIGTIKNKLETNIQYNRITGMGRYLMPREWGRDPFFTFLPRERNEGLGNVHAVTAKVNYSWFKQSVKSSLAFGYYQLPDVKDYRFNKYGMPSYAQLNADIRYVFDGLLKGMDVQLLLVKKWNAAHKELPLKYMLNKVNMTHFNLILNFRF